ncbi:Crp/Fnr family transcriptional regulator, partial [Tamlana crocina]|nr:Crp/Fnr family transcriptional regulator [Tamlana crocina]
FREGESAVNFYQVASGEIKMNNYNEDGKEFIQGIFSIGQSFGEPPLLAKVKYPANAEAISDAEVFQLSKEQFLDLLSSHPKVHLKITETLAKR